MRDFSFWINIRIIFLLINILWGLEIFKKPYTSRHDLSFGRLEQGEMSEMINLAFSNIKGMPLLIAPFTYTFIHNGGKKLNKNKTSPKQLTHWFVTKNSNPLQNCTIIWSQKLVISPISLSTSFVRL